MNEVFLQAADHIGARLSRDALWHGPRCNWLGDSMEPVNGSWVVVLRSFGSEFYSGTAGIALFLATLHARTAEPVFRRVAEGAISQALSGIDAIPQTSRHGFYTGLPGIAWVLSRLDTLLGTSRYGELALKLLERLHDEAILEQCLDVISGSAGAIPGLLDMATRLDCHRLVELAVRHGEHLLQAASRAETGWSWDTLPGQTLHNLTGYSHGAAGIALALLELYQATRDPRYREGSREGFRYEQHRFDPRQGNWPDFRDPSKSGRAQSASNPGPGFAVAWCHGAVGIGLSRLRAYKLTADTAYREEAEAAVRATVKVLQQAAFSGQFDMTLCHGIAGDAEFVLQAARQLGNPRNESYIEQIGHHAIARHITAGAPWPCGVPGGGETPNLMLGLAGIGYFLLRLHDFEHTPSVLLIHT